MLWALKDIKYYLPKVRKRKGIVNGMLKIEVGNQHLGRWSCL